MVRWLAGHSRTNPPSKQASKPRKARHVNVTAQSSAVPPSPSLHTLPSSCPLRRPARERDCVTLLTGSRLPARPPFQPDPFPHGLHPNWAYRRSTVTATSRSPATPPLRRVVSHNHTVLPTRSSVPAVANTPTANRGKRHRRSGREVNGPPATWAILSVLDSESARRTPDPSKATGQGAVRGEVLRLWRSDLLFGS